MSELNLNKPNSNSKFLMESKNIINEIKLNPENAVEIIGNETNGTFKVGEQNYNYAIKKIEPPFIDHDVELNGEIYNIIFRNSKDNESEIESYDFKGGKENLIKIYTTMYKVILNFTEIVKPDYFIIAALDSTKYFPIYSNLTKNNTIPGYHRKTVVNLDNYSDYPMTGIVIGKNNNFNEITENFNKILKKIK